MCHLTGDWVSPVTILYFTYHSCPRILISDVDDGTEVDDDFAEVIAAGFLLEGGGGGVRLQTGPFEGVAVGAEETVGRAGGGTEGFYTRITEEDVGHEAAHKHSKIKYFVLHTLII